MLYYYLKTFHFLFAMTWFAGLIASGRLFVYQWEALNDVDPSKSILGAHLKKLVKRVWYYVTWPSMLLSFFFAFWMIQLRLYHMADSWMQVKIVMVIFLVAYQIKCHMIFKAFQCDEQKQSRRFLHYVNITALAFFVAFIFLMVLKDALNWMYGTIIAPSVVIAIALLLAQLRGKKPRTP
jgi:protoporphyrinogen IX oxidase